MWLVFTQNAVNVLCRHVDFAKQQRIGFTVVAFCVIRCHTAFIPPPEMQVFPLNVVGVRLACQKLKQHFWCAAAR
ncbi:Uncharacterised protein [Vibrio cholerae]|nr:Uncharacterised protein [Vibrio cholerae]